VAFVSLNPAGITQVTNLTAVRLAGVEQRAFAIAPLDVSIETAAATATVAKVERILDLRLRRRAPDLAPGVAITPSDSIGLP
jgi:hypothetical protein